LPLLIFLQNGNAHSAANISGIYLVIARAILVLVGVVRGREDTCLLLAALSVQTKRGGFGRFDSELYCISTKVTLTSKKQHVSY
jgi:hypothetical protein